MSPLIISGLDFKTLNFSITLLNHIKINQLIVNFEYNTWRCPLKNNHTKHSF